MILNSFICPKCNKLIVYLGDYQPNHNSRDNQVEKLRIVKHKHEIVCGGNSV